MSAFEDDAIDARLSINQGRHSPQEAHPQGEGEGSIFAKSENIHREAETAVLVSGEGWKWYGYAGHFIGGSRCAFHLSTRVGAYLVSTVGDYRPNDHEAREPIGAGPNAFFETFVFDCLGEDEHGDPIVNNWGEIDSHRYGESLDAERGHYAVCHKYAAKEASPAVDGEQPGTPEGVNNEQGSPQ